MGISSNNCFVHRSTRLSETDVSLRRHVLVFNRYRIRRGASWILAACLVLAWLSFAIGQHPLQRPSILSCESAAPTRSSSLKARYISASRHDGQTHMYGSGIQHSRSDVDYMAPACPIPSDARSSCPILRSTAGRADEVEVVDADATQVVRHIVQLTGGAHTVRSEERVVGMDATWSKGVQTQRTVWRVLKKCLVRAASGGLPGAAAGLLQVVTLMWLRTLVNYQCRYGTSLAAAASELYRQGGVMRFYRGVFFALVSNPLSRFGMAAANEGATALTELLPRQASMTFTTWVASLLAAVWRVFLTPLDTCKTVLQVEGPKGFASLMNKARMPWRCSVDLCMSSGRAQFFDRRRRARHIAIKKSGWLYMTIHGWAQERTANVFSNM